MFSLFSRYLFIFALFAFFGGFSDLFAQDSDGPYKLLQTGYIDNSSPYTEKTIDGDEYVSGDFYIMENFYYPIDDLEPSSYIRKFSDDGQYALWDFYILKKNAKGKYEKIFEMENPEYTEKWSRYFSWSASISGDAKYAMIITKPSGYSPGDLITIYKRNDDDTFELFQEFKIFNGDEEDYCSDYLFDGGDKRKRSEMNHDGSVIIALCGIRATLFTKGANGKFKEQPQLLLATEKNDENSIFLINVDATPDFNFITTHEIESKGKAYRSKYKTNKYRELSTFFKKTDTGYEKYYTFEEISSNRSYFPNSFISSNADTVILSDDTVWRRKTKQSSNFWDRLKFWDNDPPYEKIQSLGQEKHFRSFSISADGSVIAAVINEDPEVYEHEGLSTQSTWEKIDYPSYAFIWQRGDDGLYKKVQSIDLGKKYPSASMTPDAKTISLSGKIFVRK